MSRPKYWFLLTWLFIFRCLEGSSGPYHYDRYPDRPAVVHLWLCEGVLPPAPPPSTRDARVSEEEAGSYGVENCSFLGPSRSLLFSIFKLPMLHCSSQAAARLSHLDTERDFLHVIEVSFRLWHEWIPSGFKLSIVWLKRRSGNVTLSFSLFV